jgi:hypothetical protein
MDFGSTLRVRAALADKLRRYAAFQRTETCLDFRDANKSNRFYRRDSSVYGDREL